MSSLLMRTATAPPAARPVVKPKGSPTPSRRPSPKTRARSGPGAQEDARGHAGGASREEEASPSNSTPRTSPSAPPAREEAHESIDLTARADRTARLRLLSSQPSNPAPGNETLGRHGLPGRGGRTGALVAGGNIPRATTLLFLEVHRCPSRPLRSATRDAER